MIYRNKSTIYIFALTVWWCWKWRCGYVFGEEGKCRDRVKFVRDKAKEVIVANKNLRVQYPGGTRVEKHDSHLLSFLVCLCYGFISRDWLVKFSHVYREANYLADRLANYAFSLSLGLYYFEYVPKPIASVLLEDCNGISRTRQICL